MPRLQFSGQRFRTFSMMLLLLSAAIAPVTFRQPSQADEPERIKACHREELRLPNHPDVRSLQGLYQRHLGYLPQNLDLGLSDQDIAQLILRFSNVFGSDKPLPSEDAVILAALRNRYSRAIASLNQQPPQDERRQVGRFSKGAGGLPRTIAPVPLPGALVDSLQTRQPLSNSRPAPASPSPSSSSSPRPAPQPPIASPPASPTFEQPVDFNTEGYARIEDNPFFVPAQVPLSTFSIDVDTASYSNVRRFLKQGQLPPKDAVRLEEMINYFDYDYAKPDGEHPFSVNTEIAQAPWNSQHQLVQIGLKGHELKTRKPSNLVFLVDVSGSMRSPNKLQLLQRSLCMLVREMQSEDRVSLVTYAGSAGLALPPTPGNEKTKILKAIANLQAGGSTAGAAGINLAYDLAQQHFLKDGNNRVILATDGDFNVGQSSNAELERLIEKKREQGVFLSVLGFGTGNYKDDKMETLANKGNGNYAYIDTLAEARKVLVEDLTSTLFTIAKDVKIQVEFNPARVQAYRLIGYENRLLKAQDFNDDRKDAGEIGAGHTVTALYEIVPQGVETDISLPTIDELKYQRPLEPSSASGNGELMQVKLRYKHPTASSSQLITRAIANPELATQLPSRNLQLAAAIAMFGMVLRDSEFKGSSTLEDVSEMLQKLNNLNAYETELLGLINQTKFVQSKMNKNDEIRD